MQGTVTYRYDEEFNLDLFEFNINDIVKFEWECTPCLSYKFWKTWQQHLRDTNHRDEYITIMHDVRCKFNILNLQLNIGIFGVPFADAIDKMLLNHKLSEGDDDYDTSGMKELEELNKLKT